MDDTDKIDAILLEMGNLRRDIASLTREIGFIRSELGRSKSEQVPGWQKLPTIGQKFEQQ